MPGAIRIGQPEIEVRLRRNALARRMVLRVAKGGHGPILTLPPDVPFAAAQAFLLEQEGWLRRHLAHAPETTSVGIGVVLPFGDTHLTIGPAPGRRIVRAGDSLLVPGTPDAVPARVGAFVREAARQTCLAAIETHAGRLERRPGRISLRDPRSRWGSCTSAGDLMFSWRLMLAPAAVLDYVVAHEVAHLAELNHSERFWAVVRRLCPDYPAPQRWLRTHGARLHGYDFTHPGA